MVVHAEHYAPFTQAPKPPVATYPLSARLAERRFRHPTAVMTSRPTSSVASGKTDIIQQLLRPVATPRPTTSPRRPLSPTAAAAPSHAATSRQSLAVPTGSDAAGGIIERDAASQVDYETYRTPPPDTRPVTALRRAASSATHEVQKHLANLALAHDVHTPRPPVVPPAQPQEDLFQRLYKQLLPEERKKAMIALATPRFRTAALKCPSGIFGFPPGEQDPQFDDDIRRDEFLYARKRALEEEILKDAENRRRAKAGREEQSKRRAQALERMLALNEESSIKKCTAMFEEMLTANGTLNPKGEARRMTRDLVASLQKKQPTEPTPKQRAALMATWDPKAKRPSHGTLLSQETRRIIDEFKTAWSKPERRKLEYQTDSAVELESAMWLEAQLDAVHDFTNPPDEEDD